MTGAPLPLWRLGVNEDGRELRRTRTVVKRPGGGRCGNVQRASRHLRPCDRNNEDKPLDRQDSLQIAPLSLSVNKHTLRQRDGPCVLPASAAPAAAAEEALHVEQDSQGREVPLTRIQGEDRNNPQLFILKSGSGH